MVFTYYLSSHYMLCPVYLCALYSPRDPNENKAQLDLYYAILATVSLDIVFLYTFYIYLSFDHFDEAVDLVSFKCNSFN